MSKKLNPLFYLLIGLAVFGLLYRLLTNTTELLNYLLMTIGLAAIVLGVFYLIMKKRGSSGFSSKYKKAVKQSRRKYGGTNNNQYSAAAKAQQKGKLDQHKRNRKNASHLRVIDGKKDKKKNRAMN